MDFNNLAIDKEAVMREAQEWVLRLTSGAATSADAAALNRWRNTSDVHRQAFAEANLMWDKLKEASQQCASDEPAFAGVAQEDRRSVRHLPRRAILGGAAAAVAAAGAGVAIVRPPLNLWPSLAEISADYHTGPGEQQQLALSDNHVSVRLNTRTSISVLPLQDRKKGPDGIQLISGEAAIATDSMVSEPFTVAAAGGRVIASNARFNIRCGDAGVSVTCQDGIVRIENAGQFINAGAGQQVAYAGERLRPPVTIDPETVTAWQRGFLVFRREPLSYVVEEVNRYRSGKIILMNAAIASQPVLATFRIDHIDEVVDRLQMVFDLRVRRLPGGIVLLG